MIVQGNRSKMFLLELSRNIGRKPAGLGLIAGMRLLTVVLGLAISTSCGHGAEPSAAFDQANRLYEQGKFTEAVGAYEQLLAQGKASAPLYFNLGNAWFRAGRLGQAILNYRLAERLSPRDPDIRANLRFARNTVAGGNASAPASWRDWALRLTINEWACLAAVGLWATFAVLAIGQIAPALRGTLKRLRTAAAFATILAAAGLLVAGLDRYGAQWVIVAGRDTVMRHGPLDESPSLQTLQAGQELQVVDQKDNWFRVAGAARGAGWLRRDQVLVLPH